MSEKIPRLLLILFGPVLIAVGGAYLYLHGGRYIETDNAYLKTNKVSISSEISGKVVEVFATDNGRVEAGQVLFRIDYQPFQIAVARAEANLTKVRGDIESLKADYLNKLADLAKSDTQQQFYLSEFKRLSRLLESNAVSRVQVDQAEYLYNNAVNQVQVTQQALEVVKARLIDLDLPLQQHPDYLLALAELNKAQLDLQHIETVAPSSGIVANLELQKGAYIIAGAPLFSLIDDSRIWVEANFKETDLTNMANGQTATIKIDSFPGIKWQGTVSSITPGTGSEFSLLPAQNSTGNWVKVVQRVTVKLDLVPSATPVALTAGMSAIVNVDTEYRRQLPWAN